MRISGLIIATILVSGTLHAQNIGINSTGAVPNASAMLDVVSTNSGILIPRVALTATNAAGPVTSPANSLLVYNTATAGTAPNNVTPGYYYWETASSRWLPVLSGVKGWTTTGNAGTAIATNFLGTTDNVGFRIRTNNSERFEFTNNGRLRAFDNGTAALPTYSWTGASAQNTGMFYPAASMLAFSSAGVERIRVSNTGLVSVNRTAATAGDVFSVYANSTGGTASPGDFAINGYTNLGYGLYGQANNTNGIGGVAVNAGTTGDAWALVGQSASRDGIAVVGLTNSTVAAGTSIGVYGESLTGAGSGVEGISTGANGNGVFGAAISTAITGLPVGVFGVNMTSRAAAIWGWSQNLNGTGIIGLGNNLLTAQTNTTGSGGAFTGSTMGVYSIATATSGVNYGAYIKASSTTGGIGIAASGNNLTPISPGVGGGGSFVGTGLGALGLATTVASGVGLLGGGNNVATIFSPAQGAGVAGTGSRYGIMGFAATTVNTDPSNSSGSAGNNASAGGYFEVLNGGTVQTWAYVGVQDNTSVLRKIIGPGTVNTIVRDLDDNLVALSAPEAPENLFQDYGQGQLENGKARIELDPILAKNIVVNDKHPLRVFIQLEGDCNGVFVTNKTGNGFDVVELQGGSSNTPFMWSVVANRADEVLPDGSISRYSAERFPAAPGAVEKTTLELAPADVREQSFDAPMRSGEMKNLLKGRDVSKPE